MSGRSRSDGLRPDPPDDLVNEVLRKLTGIGDVDDKDSCEVGLRDQVILDRSDPLETIEVPVARSQRLAEPAPPKALLVKVDSMLHEFAQYVNLVR